MFRKSLYGVAVIAGGVLGLSTLLYAKSAPEDLIKYRKNTMESLGGHMGAISLIVRERVDYPYLLDHARALAATAKTVKDVFPKDSGQGDTEAKPEIWQKPEEFTKAVEKLEKSSAAFLAAAETADKAQIGTRFKELGESCKNCHDNFRKEEKK